MRRFGSALGLCACVILISGWLVGCGQAGPLYLPQAEQPEDSTHGTNTRANHP